jgi:hypothetical protein
LLERLTHRHPRVASNAHTLARKRCLGRKPPSNIIKKSVLRSHRKGT